MLRSRCAESILHRKRRIDALRRRDFTKSLAAGLAALLSPFPRLRLARAGSDAGGGSGATLVFGYPNGFAGSASAVNVGGDAILSGSVIRMNNTPGHNSSCVWYSTQQAPTAFTTQFTFQPSGLGTSVAQSGITFCIQNTTEAERNAAGYGYYGNGYVGDANMCGYGGGDTQFPHPDSVAIKFDAGSESIGQGYPAGGLPSSTGMYINGGPAPASGSVGLCPFNDLNPNGISFYSGHVFAVTIVYDGSLLTMVLQDTTTKAQARLAWPLALANTTNPTGNWVGFTCGTSARGLFELLTWSYWSGYAARLATPTFNPPPGHYAGTETVTIDYPSGSTCYYTTNGLLPTSSSTKYTGPIPVDKSVVIQAVAIQSGFTDSLVGTGAYQINTANVINFPTGFAAGNLLTVGFAYLSGSAVRVSDTTPSTSGAAWFPIPVAVAAFTTEFTLEWGSSGQGMCFVIQNNPPLYTPTTNASSTVSPGWQINWSGGPTVVGAASGALGYGGLNAEDSVSGTALGLLNSVAIAFNQYSDPGVGAPANSVGLYTNGANPIGSQTATGLSFSSGNNGSGPSNPIKVVLTYSGMTLSLTMTDTVTGAKFSKTYTIDIPKTVGAETAYVGFTGGTGGAASIQSITAWTYTVSSAPTPVVPNAPTNLTVH